MYIYTKYAWSEKYFSIKIKTDIYNVRFVYEILQSLQMY